MTDDREPFREARPAERCSKCGSNRFVAVSLDRGTSRRAQCIPCGHIEPAALPRDWTSPHRRTDDRSEMEAARLAGLAKRHERRLAHAGAWEHEHSDGIVWVHTPGYVCKEPTPQEARPENATYTATEVKVLTAKVRQETAEEIAKALEAIPGTVYPEDIFPPDGTSVDAQTARVMRFAYPAAARIARDVVAKEDSA